MTVALSPRPAAADQISDLKAQATAVSQKLIQDQLQIGAYQQQYSFATQKVSADERTIVQIGSQRRSSPKYQAAYDFIKSGQFGDIVMAEMTWNVNQPGRWRRPELVQNLRESDVDWKRFLVNRPVEPFDPRKYLEFRLFWPYSSGIPCQ